MMNNMANALLQAAEARARISEQNCSFALWQTRSLWHWLASRISTIRDFRYSSFGCCVAVELSKSCNSFGASAFNPRATIEDWIHARCMSGCWLGS